MPPTVSNEVWRNYKMLEKATSEKARRLTISSFDLCHFEILIEAERWEDFVP
jgi:hypothetical protein